MLFKKFFAFLPSKLVFALSSSSSLHWASVADFSFRRELLPLSGLASKSDLRLYYCWQSSQFPKFRSSNLWVQGFHGLLGGLHFTLPIVKLRTSVFMAYQQRGSSSFWLLKHRSFRALTTQSSGTSVKILVSNLSSGASAPYFGC